MKFNKLAVLIAGAAMGAAIAPASAQTNPSTIVDGFESVFGKQAGFRRSGAKGVCAAATFVGNEAGREMSSSAVFSGAKVPVVARFSMGGGNPKVSDLARTTRNLALKFNLPKGESWEMANISAPFFAVATPEQMLGFLQARALDPATGKNDPEKIKAWNAANPEAKPQIDYLAKMPIPASYGSVNYWGVQAYKFQASNGRVEYIRYTFEPVKGLESLNDEEQKAKGANFLIDEIRQRAAKAPVEFNMVVQVSENGDVIDNSTVAWPDTRKRVVVGKLSIDKVSADDKGDCVGITYNPMVVPAGVGIGPDPLFVARASTYAISLGRRLGEGAKQ
jgi:catalase